MGLSEADTRTTLIDPVLHQRGWTEDLIRRKETVRMIVVEGSRDRKQGGALTALKLLGAQITKMLLQQPKERLFAA